MAVLASGCTPPGGEDRPSDGPLRGPSGSGLAGIDTPPGRAEWSASFGELLCVEGADEAVITDVTYDVVTEPAQIQTFLRRVPPRIERSGQGSWEPFITRIGGRDGFLGPRSRIEGEIEADIEGQPVDVPCRHAGGAYVQVITVMHVDARGGQIDARHIDYTADGEQFTLDIPWVLVACGDEVDALDACEGRPETD